MECLGLDVSMHMQRVSRVVRDWAQVLQPRGGGFFAGEGDNTLEMSRETCLRGVR